MVNKKSQLTKVSILLTLTIVLGLFFVMALPQVFDFNTDNIITSNDTHLFEYNFTIPDGEVYKM